MSTSSASKILVLHGPNLNLLGEREPDIYGHATLADYLMHARVIGGLVGIEIEDFQSNHEGELIDQIQRARGRTVGIIINPGAFTHSSWAIHDALAAYTGYVIEVHISNPDARESWRRTSVVAPVSTGSISGLGIHGYEMAVRAMARLLGLVD